MHIERQVIRSISFAVAAMIVTLVALPAAHAAALDVSIDLTPSTLQLAPGETSDILVTVRNSTAGSVHDLRLICYGDGSATINYEATSGTLTCVADQEMPLMAGTTTLPANGSQTWVMHVIRATDTSPGSKVYMQLRYTWQADDKPDLIAGVAIGSLEIQEPASDPIEKIAEVRIEADSDQLQEYRPVTLYVIVRNVNSVPVTLTHILPHSPAFVAIAPSNYGMTTLDPQSTQSFAFNATVTDAVRPGKNLLLVEVGLEWQKAGRRWSGSTLATHSIETGIFGESDILKALGVPSFLLLPGFLMVVTYLALWSHVKPGTEPRLKAASAEGLVVSVTLSLIAAAVYPWLTRRSYLDAYGLSDVVIVWALSIGLAILAWLIVVLVLALIHWIQMRRNLPSEKDQPIDILRKMVWQKQRVDFPPERAQVKAENIDECFIILPALPDQKKHWVVPAIVYQFDPQSMNAPVGEKSPADVFREAVDVARDRRDPEEMRRVLEEAKNKKVCTIDWNRSANLNGPRAFEIEKVEKNTVAFADFIRRKGV